NHRGKPRPRTRSRRHAHCRERRRDPSGEPPRGSRPPQSPPDRIGYRRRNLSRAESLAATGAPSLADPANRNSSATHQRLQHSFTASVTAPSPSSKASFVMISGGLILIAPPPTPTGANSITPDSTHLRTTSHAVSWSGVVVPGTTN